MTHHDGLIADLQAEATRRTTYQRQMSNVIGMDAKTRGAHQAELAALIERSDIIIDALLDDLNDSEHVQKSRPA